MASYRSPLTVLFPEHFLCFRLAIGTRIETFPFPGTDPMMLMGR